MLTACRTPVTIWSGSCTPPRVPQLRASARSPGLDTGALDILTGVVLQDYRVPVVLRQLGILEYAPDLAAKVPPTLTFISIITFLTSVIGGPSALESSDRPPLR